MKNKRQNGCRQRPQERYYTRPLPQEKETTRQVSKKQHRRATSSGRQTTVEKHIMCHFLICSSTCCKTDSLEPVLGDEAGGMRTKLYVAKKNQNRSNQSSARCQPCAHVGRFGVMLLQCGMATRRGKAHWHGCTQEHTGKQL